MTQPPQREAAETVVVSRQYRRPLGGWWFLALLLVPLLLALLVAWPRGQSGGRPSGSSSSTSAATTTPGAISCERFSDDVAAILAEAPITFVSGGSRLSPTSRETVGQVAAALARCADTKVVVTGHTDDIGSAEVNRRLGAARAATVRAELLADGVDGARVTAVGAGPDHPVASNDTPEGRARNRRVEIVAR